MSDPSALRNGWGMRDGKVPNCKTCMELHKFLWLPPRNPSQLRTQRWEASLTLLHQSSSASHGRYAIRRRCIQRLGLRERELHLGSR